MSIVYFEIYFQSHYRFWTSEAEICLAMIMR